jgi:hypothetical protein
MGRCIGTGLGFGFSVRVPGFGCGITGGGFGVSLMMMLSQTALFAQCPDVGSATLPGVFNFTDHS